ncbi:MAG: glutamate-5-semialdehyde dehydrogenase [Clostridiales bacterium]|nr:glutamate-5-semialdehyde dehydrogenase [Clostridiales bacterium]
MTTKDILIAAKSAENFMAGLSAADKNAALHEMATALIESEAAILAANAQDILAARDKISSVMLDRLLLTPDRIKAMAEGVKKVAALPDPVGEVLSENTRPDGLKISKISVPLGVVAIIYESRPNVTSDAAALCFKSGNACVLRTGKEAHRSAAAIVKAMRAALEKCGIDGSVIGFIEDTSRQSANELMQAKGYVDLLIPRGGAGLIRACVENATVPCIETGTGICHIYADGAANFEKALNIIENAKCSRPSVCNAAEVCLVDKKIAGKFLPLLWERLVEKRLQSPVEIIADEGAYALLKGRKNCRLAGESDFDTEFLDYKLAVALVGGVGEAIAHIAAHSTHHSDCIVTEDSEAAQKFVAAVDSAAVYVNASTRFTDGGEFGLGCEMGISTQKLHARGPMGLKELTAYKYVVRGDGNVR